MSAAAGTAFLNAAQFEAMRFALHENNTDNRTEFNQNLSISP